MDSDPNPDPSISLSTFQKLTKNQVFVLILFEDKFTSVFKFFAC
jgi:hypothetical protein